jgi:hypothetical protein
VAKFKYLEKAETNLNLIHEELKSSLDLDNACCHTVQNILPSLLLSKYVKIGIHKNVILPVVLYGCETCSVILREEHRVGVFENRVLRGLFGPKRDEVVGDLRELCNEELHTLYQI